MDPYDEQRLREEVIYLHSLWHQGPPRSTSTNCSNGPLHQLSNRTQFKRQRAKPRDQRGNRNNRNQEGSSTESIQDSGKEWPCNPSSDTPTHSPAWPTVTAQKNSQPISFSPEEQARLAANLAQAKALKATKDYFRSNNSDDDDNDLGNDGHDDNEGEESEDQDNLTEEGYGVEKYRFFAEVFEEDSELREYYQKNYQNGDFFCLVCYGVGRKKASKRFKDCVALVQHSVSIAKTKKRRAHRFYGKGICKVLGWDIHKLPAIVSALSANDGVSLSNSDTSEAQSLDNQNVLGDTEAQADIGNGNELQESESTGSETKPNDVESLVFQENSLIAADTAKCDEDPNLADPNIAEVE